MSNSSSFSLLLKRIKYYATNGKVAQARSMSVRTQYHITEQSKYKDMYGKKPKTTNDY